MPFYALFSCEKRAVYFLRAIMLKSKEVTNKRHVYFVSTKIILNVRKDFPPNPTHCMTI